MKNSIFNNILPNTIGPIHFIGIGGIGMSGIAEILHNLGYQIQGSDLSDNYVTERIKNLGIKFFQGHKASNIEDASLVVKSTAIKDDNPELKAALDKGIPVIKRSEMLAELMRFKLSIAISGTHGKTTTTSLVAKLFEAADLNPTVINGGIINQHGTNAYLGSGDYLVAEADESDGTFIKVPSYIGVITNIDPEHLDYYGSFENAKNAFISFINNLPFYGFGVLCFDHPVVREIATKIQNRKFLTYGIESTDIDFRATNIEIDANGSTFDVEINSEYAAKKGLQYTSIKGLKLGLHGKHNITNSLAAIAIGVEKDMPVEVIKTCFDKFQGIKRRFTLTGTVSGISIYDDYAHHPVEIKATLSTARQICNLSGGNLIAVMQPHRYTRLSHLMDEFATCFTDADKIIISDVYEAGEKLIPGATSDDLIKNIKKLSGLDAIKLDSPINLPKTINNLAKSGDIVVLLGAGNITNWAYDLPKSLEKLAA